MYFFIIIIFLSCSTLMRSSLLLVMRSEKKKRSRKFFIFIVNFVWFNVKCIFYGHTIGFENNCKPWFYCVPDVLYHKHSISAKNFQPNRENNQLSECLTKSERHRSNEKKIETHFIENKKPAILSPQKNHFCASTNMSVLKSHRVENLARSLSFLLLFRLLFTSHEALCFINSHSKLD